MTKATCAVEMCDRQVRSRGCCPSHYARLLRYGDVQASVPLGYRAPRGSMPQCEVAGCENRSRARNLCTLHYQRWQAHGSVDRPPAPPRKADAGTFKHGSPQGYNFHKCRCDECAAWKVAYEADYNARRPGTQRRLQLAAYGLTVAEFHAMSEAQGHACLVCRAPEGSTKRRTLYVDHDHKTGHVRGLLCHHCNVAAGHLQDDPALCEALAAYLRAG